MGEAEKIIAEINLREEIADAHLSLTRFGVNKVRSKLGTPQGLCAAAATGVLVGFIRKKPATASHVRDLEDQIATLKSTIRQNGPAAPATGNTARLDAEDKADQQGVSSREALVGAVSSLITSLVARFVFAKFFTNAEPEFDLSDNV